MSSIILSSRTYDADGGTVRGFPIMGSSTIGKKWISSL